MQCKLGLQHVGNLVLQTLLITNSLSLNTLHFSKEEIQQFTHNVREMCFSLLEAISHCLHKTSKCLTQLPKVTLCALVDFDVLYEQ